MQAKESHFGIEDVTAPVQGDRVGICVTQLDPEGIERCWLAAPGSVPSFQTAVAALEKIRFFAGEVRSRQRLHVTVGHATMMAEIQFFGLPDGEGEAPAAALQGITSRIGALAEKVHNCIRLCHLQAFEGRKTSSVDRAFTNEVFFQRGEADGQSLQMGCSWPFCWQATAFLLPPQKCLGLRNCSMF